MQKKTANPAIEQYCIQRSAMEAPFRYTERMISIK